MILDETKTPADTISNEVKKEANDHLFFYTPSGVNEVITIQDKDTHTPPLPIGLQTTWKTGAANTSTTKKELRHQANVKDGSYTPKKTKKKKTKQTRKKKKTQEPTEKQWIHC